MNRVCPISAAVAVVAALATGVTHAQTPPAATVRQSPLAPAAEAQFNEGVEALKAGRLDEAEGAFRDVLRTASQVAFVPVSWNRTWQVSDSCINFVLFCISLVTQYPT